MRILRDRNLSAERNYVFFPCVIDSESFCGYSLQPTNLRLQLHCSHTKMRLSHLQSDTALLLYWIASIHFLLAALHTNELMQHYCAHNNHYTINSLELDSVIVVGMIFLRRPNSFRGDYLV